MKREFRVGQDPELIESDGTAPMIRGYAAVFNQETVIGGMFREVIRPGAFRRTMEPGADVAALVEHKPELLLGRTTSGTARVTQDETGLRIEVDPPDTSCGRDAVVSLRRKDRSKMSFGFMVPAGGDKWTRSDGQLPLRELLDVETFDVSLVAFPAYSGTSADVRSMFPDGAPEVPKEEVIPPVPEVSADEVERMGMRIRLAEAE